MVNELAHAVMDLILVGRAHRAPLAAVIDAAREVREVLTASWIELGQQVVIEEELAGIEVRLDRVIQLLAQMEQAPHRSWRAELAAECTHLYAINDALRELVEHRAAVHHAPWLITSVMVAAAALHALRLAAARREEEWGSWAELPALRVVSLVHLEKLGEVALGELRIQSDARFCFKRWSAGPDDDQPHYGYVFENRRYRLAREAPPARGEPKALAILALSEHRQQAFSTFVGVALVQQILQALAVVRDARRAAA
jgi:hypothetical protein